MAELIVALDVQSRAEAVEKAYSNRKADTTVTESIEEYYKQKLEKNNETTITDYGLPEEN